MDKITRDVFVTKNTIKEPIMYVQATNAIPIEFIFRDWTIPDAAVAKTYVSKPSGKATYDTAIIKENTVFVNVRDQTFSESGTSLLQIQVVKGENTLVSYDFPVIVEKNRVAGDVPESENQSNFIDEYLEKLDTTIKESVNKGVEYIKEKADNGEFTGTVSVGTITTGDPGTQASVTNRGTSKDAILDMTIPRGDTGKIENIDTATVEFTESETRDNIISGETFKEMLGKIKKFFTDLKTVAFTGNYSDLENTPLYGGENILNATNQLLELGSTSSWSKRTWRTSQSGSNPSGERRIVQITDAPNPQIIYGVEIINSSGRIMVSQDSVPFMDGNTYTISCYARSTEGNGKLILQVGAGAGWNSQVFDITNTWRRYSMTFSAKLDSMNVYLGNDAVSTLQICGAKLETGDCATDWSYSPNDIDARNAEKLDKSRVVESAEITEPGYVMDGKTVAEALKALNSRLSNICDGGVVSTTIPSNNASTVSIKFNKTFQKPPAFTCQLRTSQVGADKVIIKSVTATGAEVYAYSATTTHSAWVHWNAVSLDY